MPFRVRVVFLERADLMEDIETLLTWTFDERMKLAGTTLICEACALGLYCRTHRLSGLQQYIRSTPRKHPYINPNIAKLAENGRELGLGPPTEPRARYLYRIAGDAPSSLVPVSSIPADFGGEDVEFEEGFPLRHKATDWVDLDTVYLGKVTPAPYAFWADIGEFGDELLNIAYPDLLKLILKLGVGRAYQRYTLLKLPVSKAVERGCHVPCEIDAIDLKEFVPQTLTPRPDSGITLDLNNRFNLQPGMAEYLVRETGTQDVQFFPIDFKPDVVKESVATIRSQNEGSYQDGNSLFGPTILERAIFDHLKGMNALIPA